jgi:hypothetical protein
MRSVLMHTKILLVAAWRFVRAARARGHGVGAAWRVGCARLSERLNEEAAALDAGQRPWFGA